MRPALIICLWLALTSSAFAQLIINGNGTISVAAGHPGYVSGDWYLLSYPGLFGSSGNAPGTNVVTCDAAYVPLPVTIKALGADVTSVQASSHVSMAIYTNSASSRPGTLVDFAATALASVGGSVTGALNNATDTLTAGIYWVCYVFDAASPALFSVHNSSFTMAWLLGSTTQASVESPTANMTAIKCTVSSTTCGSTGSGWGVWSGTTFTWGDATLATWTDSTTIMGSLISMQVN